MGGADIPAAGAGHITDRSCSGRDDPSITHGAGVRAGYTVFEPGIRDDICGAGLDCRSDEHRGQ